jgi:hypothetical protein
MACTLTNMLSIVKPIFSCGVLPLQDSPIGDFIWIGIRETKTLLAVVLLCGIMYVLLRGPHGGSKKPDILAQPAYVWFLTPTELP